MIPPLAPLVARNNSSLKQNECEQKEIQKICDELIASIRLLPTDEGELFKLCDAYEKLLQDPLLGISSKRELFKEISFLLKCFPQDHPEVNRKLVSYLLDFAEFGSDVTPEVSVLIYVLAYKICIDPVQRQKIACHLSQRLEEVPLMHAIKNYSIAAGNREEEEFKERLGKLGKAAARGLGESVTLLRNPILNALNTTILRGDQTPSYYHFLNTLFKKDTQTFFPDYLQKRLAQQRSSMDAKFTHLFSDGKIRDIDPIRVRELQKEISQEFNQFLEDLTALPCLLFEHNKLPTEIHVAGSLAREEVYPFSDFEGMILFDDPIDPGGAAEQKTLLCSAVDYISLLVAGLGETMALPLEVQPLIHCQKGFALDALFARPPLTVEEMNQNTQILLATPSQLQSLQKSGETDETRLALYSLRKTKKIGITYAADFGYEEHNQAILNETIQDQSRRETIALRMIQEMHLPHYRDCFAFQGSRGWVERPLETHESIDIKKHFIKILFHAVTTLSIYYGINNTNILDIVDALKDRNLISPESHSLLQEAVSSIYLIRLKMHLAFIKKPWKGSYDIALLPIQANVGKRTLSNNGYPLEAAEFAFLKKAYWLVIKPLYHCLQQIGKTIPTIDLVPLAFTTTIEDILHGKILLGACIPFITSYVNYLVEQNTSEENILHLYQQLSTSVKYEPLRKTYLEELARSSAYDALIQKLILIRNRDGFQQARCIQENCLLQDIQAMGQSAQEASESALELQVEMVIPSFSPVKLKSEIVKDFFDPETGGLNPYAATNLQLKEYENCRHTVRSIPQYNLHVKELPDHPCMEYAAYSLTHRLFDHGPPPTQLVKVNISKIFNKGSYPVLISRTVKGKVFDPENDEVDPGYLTELLIGHLLLLPGDANARNFIFHESHLTCIDNDVGFVDPVVAQTGLWKSFQVHFTSILFCLKKGFLLDEKVIEQFCALDPLLVLNGWLHDLMEREKSYLAFFPEVQMRKKFLETNHEKTFTPFMILSSGCVARLYEQMILLQSRFREPRQTRWTPFEMLNQLVGRSDQAGLKTTEIGPYIKKAYERASQQSPAIERLQQAVGRDISQSMTSSQAILAQIGKVPFSEELEKRELFSPEQGLKELFAIDFERCTELGLIVRESGHASFKSAFQKMVKEGQPDLERQRLVLMNLLRRPPESKNMKALNLSHCAVLEDQDLERLVLSFPELERLDLRYCRLITSRSVEVIAKHLKNLKELYISGCTQITVLEAQGLFGIHPPLVFEALTILHASHCPLTRFQVKADQLVELKINGYLALSILSLTSPSLEILHASHIKDFSSIVTLKTLKKLVLNGCSQLSDGNMEQIMRNNHLLTHLELHTCLVTRLPSHPRLEALCLSYVPIFTIEGDYENLTVLDLKYCGKLHFLFIISPFLEQLIAENCTALMRLHITTKRLKKLILRWSPNVVVSQELLFAQRGLELLDLSHNRNLLIENLEVLPSALPRLQQLYLNQCSCLKQASLTFVSPFPKLQSLCIEKSDIKSLSVQGDDIKEINLNDNPHLSLTNCRLLVKNLDIITLIGCSNVNRDLLNGFNVLSKCVVKTLFVWMDGKTNVEKWIHKLSLVGRIHIHLIYRELSIEKLLKFMLASPNSIRELNLSSLRLGCSDIKALAGILPRTQIATLNLATNEIDFCGTKMLAEVLPLTQITELVLQNNKIEEAGAQTLAEALPHTQVVNLNLQGNNIRYGGMITLARVLPFTQITELNIGDNQIEYSGVKILAETLPRTRITKLNLINNHIGEVGVLALAKILRLTRILKLYLGTNGIGDGGIKALAEILPGTLITELDLRYNSIGKDGIKELADALPHSKVSRLNLWNNQIRDEGAKVLAQILPFSQITELNLWSNQISDEGASVLSQVLPFTQITELYLGDEEIGERGVRTLVQVLPKTQLRRLNLGGNQIGDGEITSLAEVLPYSQIIFFKLQSNRIGTQGICALEETRKKYPHITILF